MKCSNCDSMSTRVIDSRVTEKGYTIRRRRACESCDFRFTTYEYVFPKKIVIKKNGVRPLIVVDAENFLEMIKGFDNGR